MRFANKKEDFIQTVETVALIVSLGAVFFQIWILISSLDAYFKGKYANLLPSVLLSGVALMAGAISVFLTKLNFLKGITEGRSKTYQKNS